MEHGMGAIGVGERPPCRRRIGAARLRHPVTDGSVSGGSSKRRPCHRCGPRLGISDPEGAPKGALVEQAAVGPGGFGRIGAAPEWSVCDRHNANRCRPLGSGRRLHSLARCTCAHWSQGPQVMAGAPGMARSVRKSGGCARSGENHRARRLQPTDSAEMGKDRCT